MKSPALAVRMTATVLGALYAAALYAAGIRLQSGAKQALSYTPTLLTWLIALWDVWLWRQRPFLRFARRPRLGGLWATTIRPTDESHIPTGGNRGPIEAYVVIVQSYWAISVRQYTAESVSDSHAAFWMKRNPEQRTLTYTYANRPEQRLESRSRANTGTAILEVTGTQPSELTGYYFTDRYTKGDMRLVLQDRTTAYSTWEQARARAAQ